MVGFFPFGVDLVLQTSSLFFIIFLSNTCICIHAKKTSDQSFSGLGIVDPCLT